MTPSRLVGFFFLALVGCSRSGPPLVAVTGTVTLDDRPLEGAQVTFIPADAIPGAGASGRTGPDGKYLLHSRNGNGIAAGEYRVIVSKRVMPDGVAVPPDDPTPPIRSPARETLPRYSNPNRPVLTAAVLNSGSTLDFALQSGGRRH